MNRLRTAPVALRTQRGATLISMMVGMLLSLLSIAAMLAVYKATAEAATTATGTTQREGQLASALLGAQIELQQAGFGVDAGIDRLAVTQTQVLWRYRPDLDGQLTCAGLRLGGASQTGTRSLLLLQPTPCEGALVAGPARALAVMDGVLVDSASNDTGSIDVGALVFDQVPDATCLPYEQQRDGATYLPVSGEVFSTCLPNLGQRVRLLQGHS